MNTQCGATIVAFDIEFINPSFHRHLIKNGARIVYEDYWDKHVYVTPEFRSHKISDCAWIEYTNVTANNEFLYLTSDEYELTGWDYLQKMIRNHQHLVQIFSSISNPPPPLFFGLLTVASAYFCLICRENHSISFFLMLCIALMPLSLNYGKYLSVSSSTRTISSSFGMTWASTLKNTSYASSTLYSGMFRSNGCLNLLHSSCSALESIRPKRSAATLATFLAGLVRTNTTTPSPLLQLRTLRSSLHTSLTLKKSRSGPGLSLDPPLR